MLIWPGTALPSIVALTAPHSEWPSTMIALVPSTAAPYSRLAIKSAVVSLQAEELRSLTASACCLHTELNAVATLRLGTSLAPLPLDHGTADLLGNAVLAFREHPAAWSVLSDTWTSRWKALIERLINGETEADLSRSGSR